VREDEEAPRVRLNIFQSTDNHLRIDNKIDFPSETRPRASSPDGGRDN